MSTERAGLIAPDAKTSTTYDEESIDKERARAPRRAVSTTVAVVGVVLLAATVVFLLAHDAARAHARALGDVFAAKKTDREEKLSRPQLTRDASNEGAMQARLGGANEAKLGIADRLAMRLVLVPGTANAAVLNLGATESGSHPVAGHAPKFLSRWASAPYWLKNTYIPIHETPESANAKVVVVGHATDIQKFARHWLSSATHWGLAARLSGNGTKWNGWEDKTMGLKTNLYHLRGDPIVIASDTGDVYFSCSQDDIEKRFEATRADMIASGETQLWPEVRSYFDMKDILDFKMKQSDMGDIGKAAEPEVGDGKPYRWPNAGLIMGRRSALLKYIEAVENLLYEIPDRNDLRFKANCKPFRMDVETAIEAHFSDGFYDDQLCLNAYLMQKLSERNFRVKIDLDGSIINSPGGIDMDMMKQDPVSGRVYNAMTGKSPCAWHFNNPLAKTRMVLAVEKFPNFFVSNAAGEERITESRAAAAAAAKQAAS